MDVKLNDSELTKAKKRFKEFDVDGDGTVSWDDYKKYLIRKKENDFQRKLQLKQKQLLGLYTDAMKHLGGRAEENSSESPAAKKKPAKKKHHRVSKKPRRQLSEADQKELASLDPFAPGKTDDEKAKIWARINQLVGDDTEEDSEFDSDIEQVSFSEDEEGGSADGSDENAGSKKTTPKAGRKSKSLSRKSSGKNLGDDSGGSGVFGGVKRSLTNKKRGERDTDSGSSGKLTSAGSAPSNPSVSTTPSKNPTKSRTTQRTGTGSGTGAARSKPKEDDNSKSDDEDDDKPKRSASGKGGDDDPVSPRKPLTDLRKSASHKAKKGSKVMSGVLKKAEEGAKAAKNKLMKDQIQEEQVDDPDDPELFAAAYKKNH